MFLGQTMRNAIFTQLFTQHITALQILVSIKCYINVGTRRWFSMRLLLPFICHCSISHEHFVSLSRLTRLQKKPDKRQSNRCYSLICEYGLQKDTILYNLRLC